MQDDSTPRDPLAAKADALEKALAELEAEKQAVAALAAKNAPQIERNKALEKQLAGLSQSERRKVLDGSGLRHISAAPRPIKPLRASGPMTTAKREDAPRKPIAWNLWANAPEVALWEAAALLLDIDPRSLQPLRDGWMAGPGRGPFFEARSFPSDTKSADFDTALSFAERAAKVAGPIYLRTGLAVGMNKRTAQVSLAEVVAFFVSCEWPDIPAPLLALVPTAEDRTAPPVFAVATATESAPEVNDAATVEPVARWQAQEQTILNKLRELGHSPDALPKSEAWKPGVKSEVRAAIGWQGMWHSPKVFDKAWERLRERGEIADKP